MTLANRIKLSAMMFLEFFIWGTLFVILGAFLDNNLQVSGAKNAAFSTQSFDDIIVPFVIGLVSDCFIVGDQLHDWQSIWLIPSGIALIVTILFVIFFKEKHVPKEVEEALEENEHYQKDNLIVKATGERDAYNQNVR